MLRFPVVAPSLLGETEEARPLLDLSFLIGRAIRGMSTCGGRCRREEGLAIAVRMPRPERRTHSLNIHTWFLIA